MARDNLDTSIRAVIYKEADQWVAQCLEYDIGAQAPDVDTLRTRLEMTLRAEHTARNGTDSDPFPGIDPAPAHFHKMWERCPNHLTPPAGAAGIAHEKPIRMALCA